MPTSTAYHVDTADAFRARAYLADGDLSQASEKGWGAAARMVKAVAESRGWKHHSHGDRYRVVNRLSNALEDRRLRSLCNTANSLHENFYEGPMPVEFIADALDEVEALMARLTPLLPPLER